MSIFPQRPKRHISGDEAVRIFTSSCSPDWIVSPVQPDYGLDLRIELVQNNQVTGEEFYVQIKGRNQIQTLDKQIVEVEIPQSTINYWLGKLHPVLIVLVDVTQKRFWFDWLEYAYSEYPRSKDDQRNVSLTLSGDGAKDSIINEIPNYLTQYFTRLHADLGNLFESTQLTRVLLHVSALHRLCAQMALTLQGDHVKQPEELKELVYWFYLEFGLHDEFLVTLWDNYTASQVQISPKMAETLGSKLNTYVGIREKFFMREHRQQTGDFWFIPVKYSDLITNLLPMFAVLAEIEDMLLQALVLGKIVFPQIS